MVHGLSHTVVNCCFCTITHKCQWNPCMMVMLVQQVSMQYCSYNEHSAGHYWYCMINTLSLFNNTILYFILATIHVPTHHFLLPGPNTVENMVYTCMHMYITIKQISKLCGYYNCMTIIPMLIQKMWYL